MPRFLSFCILALSAAALAWPAIVAAQNFHDQGLVTARVRTDYNATNAGTAANKLRIVNPCLWPPGTPNMIDPVCRSAPREFSQSNYFQQNGGGSSSSFWMLVMNNEPWYSTANSGPPDQSLPRVPPGSGVMGFTMLKNSLPGETFWRAHLVLNHTFQNPVGQGAIPYMSIGADAGRGNGGDVGTLSLMEPHVVQFTSRVWDYFVPASGAGAFNHYMWVESAWGGKPRLLFINLFHYNISWSYPWLAGLNRKWNWPFLDSAFYPGADIAFYDSEDTLTHCQGFYVQPLLYKGHQVTYQIDLLAAFRCASKNGLFETPMPASQTLPIRGVHWANEITGDGVALWTSVHGMRMLPGENVNLYSTPGSSPEEVRVSPETPDGAATAAIREALVRGCERNEECFLNNNGFFGIVAPPAMDYSRVDPYSDLRQAREALLQMEDGEQAGER